MRGLGDQRKAVAPVVAVAGEQPHALALALDDQAVAVVLDLVKPIRAGRDLSAAGRDAGPPAEQVLKDIRRTRPGAEKLCNRLNFRF